MRDAIALLEQAEAAGVAGWDFGWLDGRWSVTPPPWDFTSIAADAMRKATRALDMGTGGGEWLAAIPRAPLTVATEAWPPNVPVAHRTLRPLGVPVVQDEGAVDNVDQRARPPLGRLPFSRGAFDLVINRHESFVAREVASVLRAGGSFLTQQAGSGTDDLCALLDVEPPAHWEFDLELASAQLHDAGLRVTEAAKGDERMQFHDIGALAWYLRRVPWAVPDFSLADQRDKLVRLHGQQLEIRATRFWLRARR